MWWHIEIETTTVQSHLNFVQTSETRLENWQKHDRLNEFKEEGQTWNLTLFCLRNFAKQTRKATTAPVFVFQHVCICFFSWLNNNQFQTLLWNTITLIRLSFVVLKSLCWCYCYYPPNVCQILYIQMFTHNFGIRFCFPLYCRSIAKTSTIEIHGLVSVSKTTFWRHDNKHFGCMWYWFYTSVPQFWSTGPRLVISSHSNHFS